MLWEEALEGRAAYSDRAGALNDVTQNYMMQVLCMAAMERPEGAMDGTGGLFSAQELRRRKVEFLRCMRDLPLRTSPRPAAEPDIPPAGSSPAPGSRAQHCRDAPPVGHVDSFVAQPFQ